VQRLKHNIWWSTQAGFNDASDTMECAVPDIKPVCKLFP